MHVLRIVIIGQFLKVIMTILLIYSSEFQINTITFHYGEPYVSYFIMSGDFLNCY